MNKNVKKLVLLGLSAVMALSVFAGCAKEESNSFEGKKTRVVIGSTSTTGDSYMIADTAMRFLSKELKADTKVDAVGAGPAFEAIVNEKADGTTIMMFHDMTYLGISFGAFEDKYALENMVVGPRVGQNPGSLFAASKDAPYDDMKEMAEWLAANPEEVVRVAVVIFADYSSLLQYTEEGVDEKLAMKFVGVLDEIDGDDTPTYKEMGITLNGEPFVFSKDFVIYLPKDIDPAFVAELDKAVEAISTNQEFIDAMAKLKYKVAYLPAAETDTFIKAKRDSLDALIKSAPSLDELTVK